MSEWSAFLNRPGTELIFLLLPVVVFSVGGLAIYGCRKRQLSRWNLRDSPVAPSTAAHLRLPTAAAVLAIAILAGIAFGLDFAPDQRNRDIVCGFIGIGIGWFVCFRSINWANRSYLRGSGQ